MNIIPNALYFHKSAMNILLRIHRKFTHACRVKVVFDGVLCYDCTEYGYSNPTGRVRRCPITEEGIL